MRLSAIKAIGYPVVPKPVPGYPHLSGRGHKAVYAIYRCSGHWMTQGELKKAWDRSKTGVVLGSEVKACGPCLPEGSGCTPTSSGGAPGGSRGPVAGWAAAPSSPCDGSGIRYVRSRFLDRRSRTLSPCVPPCLSPPPWGPVHNGAQAPTGQPAPGPKTVSGPAWPPQPGRGVPRAPRPLGPAAPRP